jgi:SOS-response transcriptional repressor LexA
MSGPLSPTPRQLELLRFIAGYQLAHGGVSPSFVEMTAGLGLSSTAGIARLLDGLEERGAIRRLHSRERAIELLADVPVPRAPEGAPLFFIPIERRPA